MVFTTPFHPRLAELNTAELWGHWSGHLSATQYTTAPKHEYFGVRNAVGLFDASPLYKYAISGRDAERFLGGIFARDIRTCRPGRAQYTLWCDDRGFVLEDGVVFRHSVNDFLLTAAEPNLSFLENQIGSLDVTIDEVSSAVRSARRPGQAGQGSSGVAGPRGRGAALLRPRPDEDRRHCRDSEPYRLQRRSRLRADGPRRRRARRLRRRVGGRPRSSDAPVRRHRSRHPQDRGRPAAHRPGVHLEPLRIQRPRPVHPGRARAGVVAQGHRGRDASVRRSPRDPCRARRPGITVVHRRHRRRLGCVRRALLRRGTDAAQGRAGRGLGDHALRRVRANAPVTRPATSTRRCSRPTSGSRGCDPSSRLPAPASRWS